MGKKLAYERYHWVHGQIKGERFPNARKLAEKFEISAKQAQRDIEFMRDRLGAPFFFVHGQKGYDYEDNSYELPPVWFKEDELLALCLALRLAATIPDRNLKTSLYALLEKLLSFRFLESTPRMTDIREKVSVKNIQYYKVDEAIFHQVMDSLFQNESLKISYYSPHKHEKTERVVQPLHLLCYMGSWHLIAFCFLKNELRDFALSRIRAIDSYRQPVKLPENLPSLNDYIDRNFGVMIGDKSIEVCLQFSSEIADWVYEQVWHNGQQVFPNEDGSICLKFPVADFREIRREILKYGSKVEVLSPTDLRTEIKEEIERMKNIYR